MSFRRSWDKAAYEAKAQARADGYGYNDDDNEDTADSKSKFPRPGTEAYLTHRNSLGLESKAGTVEVVQQIEGDDRGPGYRCEACDWVAKDSQSYLTHMNSIEHNR